MDSEHPLYTTFEYSKHSEFYAITRAFGRVPNANLVLGVCRSDGHVERCVVQTGRDVLRCANAHLDRGSVFAGTETTTCEACELDLG